MAGEQFGKHLQHRGAVLDHVGNAGRHPGVVLQNIEIIRTRPDDINPHHMGIDVARRGEAAHLRHEGPVAVDQCRWNDTGANDFLTMIDVGKEGIDRRHPLNNATLEPAPFTGGDNPRNQVERDDPLLTVAPSIDIEGNPDPPKEFLGLKRLFREFPEILIVKPGQQ